MKYIFNVADVTPAYRRVTITPSQNKPGYWVCARDGVIMVVEPSGLVRDITKEEIANNNSDSAWTQAALYGDMLIYDTAPEGQPYHVVVFKVMQ